MSTEIKLTKDDEADSVDSSKYRGMIGSLPYLTAGTGVETIVYADSDHAGDYVDHKSTSGVCTFMECCLTSWFTKKQTALDISTTEAEYVSAEKACQQALWMKQALIDYDIRLNDVLIMLYGGGGILFQLKSDSLPHAHAQTTMTYYKHQDSIIKKAQELKTKTSANSNIQDLPKSYQDYQDNDCQGRLLESFQEDAKYEHVGQDTRSKGGKDDQDKQEKDLKISKSKAKSKDNDKGSRSYHTA
ncbi:hypothetical protein Tco_0659388 [Tanacetum coccineum]